MFHFYSKTFFLTSIQVDLISFILNSKCWLNDLMLPIQAGWRFLLFQGWLTSIKTKKCILYKSVLVTEVDTDWRVNDMLIFVWIWNLLKNTLQKKSTLKNTKNNVLHKHIFNFWIILEFLDSMLKSKSHTYTTTLLKS